MSDERGLGFSDLVLSEGVGIERSPVPAGFLAQIAFPFRAHGDAAAS